MGTLTKQFESRVGASLERTGLKPSTFGLRAVGYLNPVRQLLLAAPRGWRWPPGPVGLQPGPSGPCSLPRGNAPRNSSPNRTEADR